MTRNFTLNIFFLSIIANLVFFSFFTGDVYGISYSFETPAASKTLVVDEPYMIKLKVGDHKGLSNLEHANIKMKINDFQNTSSISIMWTQLDGKPIVTIDNDELVTDVIVESFAQGFLEFRYEFTPIQEFELLSISVDVLERKLNAAKESSETKNDSSVLNNKEHTLLKSKKYLVSQHGIERNTSLFDSYMLGQQLIAQDTFSTLVGNKTIQNHHFGENYNESIKKAHLSRSDDIKLQNTIFQEMQRAEELFERLYHVQYNFDE